MSTFFADYPPPGGVTSLDGMTGALTLVAGSGISITNGVGTITITNTSPSAGGTVTSVGLADNSTSPIYSISGSPVTTAGTLAFTLNTQAANRVFAGPTTGSATQPSFRALVSADIPNLSAIYVTQSEVGQPNGVASLDGGGKIPLSQLPSSLMEFQGNWDSSTNTPTLVDGTGTTGFTYWVDVASPGPIAGLTDPSMINFQIGDLVIYNGTKWVLTTPAAGVQSVNGAQGAVTVNAINQLTGDATAGPASGSQSQALTLATVNSNVGSFTNANITVNAKGLITAASNGVPAGANTALSNLTSPTAINQNLIFNTGATAIIQTADDPAVATQPLFIQSGSATATGNSGNVTVTTGVSATGNSGNLNLNTADTAGSGMSGNISISPGAGTGTGGAGNIDIEAGSIGVGGTGVPGTTTIRGGSSAVASIGSESTTISGGQGSNGAAGGVVFINGGTSDTGNTGNIQIATFPSSATRGKIQLQDGTEGTSGYVWTSIDTAGTGSWIASSGGTVSAVSVATANGLAGTSSGGATPALTLTTTVTGLLKGNGTAISAASAGTDYVIPSGSITGTASNITASSNSTLTTLSSLTSVGTIATGVWNGTAVGPTFGGTGQTSYATGDILYASATNVLSKRTIGTSGQILTVSAGVPVWSSPAATASNAKDTFVLSNTDITNQFVTLAHTPIANSTNLLVQGGGVQLEGASYDYTVSSNTIVFQNGLATGGSSALVAGDVIQVQYEF